MYHYKIAESQSHLLYLILCEAEEVNKGIEWGGYLIEVEMWYTEQPTVHVYPRVTQSDEMSTDEFSVTVGII